MKYDIFISDVKKTKVLQLPVIPENLPPKSRNSENEEFETFSNGKYNFIGNVSLMEISLESYFPGKEKNYSFLRVKNTNPQDYINLINTAQDTKKPIRLVIVRDDGSNYVNGTFSVESFEYYINRIGDYPFTLALKEWRDPDV